MAALLDRLNEDVLLPDLLRQAPQVRPVLDRYGLRGCGGRLGPVESLGFFARAHDVPVDRLLGELRLALGRPAPAAPAVSPAERWADAAYRPFFLAGIALVLTLGAVWGACLLLRIGWTGAFHAAGLHEVNAHGHAQVFGWVGLFVMGFAYQAFPRFKHTSLALPGLAFLSLLLMVAGVVGRSGLEPFAGLSHAVLGLALAASALELAAVSLFVLVIAATWRRSGKPLAVYDAYIASALVWFLVITAYDAVYFAATVLTTERAGLVALVATWQAPLRELQIHGFALLMILGVSQRVFPHFYGLPAPSPTLSRLGVVAVNLAVCGVVAGLVLMRLVDRAWAGLWYGSVLVLAATVVLLVWDWKVFTAPARPDRSWKFLRAAYVWLLISLAMLVLVPVYQFVLLPALAPEGAATAMGFSHAYYGAARHAVTVGFVSLMIVGVAAKVVPTLNGVDVRALTALWGPFLLLNAGCTLRVVGQILTDVVPAAFPVAAVSGLLEVTGLAWWGLHLCLVMAGLARTREGEAGRLPFPSGGPVQPEHCVGDVLDRHPELLGVFLHFGFAPLANPVLRRVLAPRTTVARACQMQAVEEAALLHALNERLGCGRVARVSLPVFETAPGPEQAAPDCRTPAATP